MRGQASGDFVNVQLVDSFNRMAPQASSTFFWSSRYYFGVGVVGSRECELSGAENVSRVSRVIEVIGRECRVVVVVIDSSSSSSSSGGDVGGAGGILVAVLVAVLGRSK